MPVPVADIDKGAPFTPPRCSVWHKKITYSETDRVPVEKRLTTP
jgi:hypothetical protein